MSGSRSFSGKRVADVVIDGDSDSSEAEFVWFDDSPPPAKRARTDAGPSNAKQAEPTVDSCVAEVLAIIPDCAPAHVVELTARFEFGLSADAIVNHLLDTGDYPRITIAKGKQKAREPDEREPEIDYLAAHRTTAGLSVLYSHIGIEQLGRRFPTVPIPFIRQSWQQHKFYAKAYYALKAATDAAPDRRIYKPLKSARKPPSSVMPINCDEQIEKEIIWVERREALERRNQTEEEQQRLAVQKELATGAFAECMCCCEECVPISQAYFCTEAHSFCKECAVRNAETQIGLLKHELPCPSMDGCDGTFVLAEVERFLPPKSIEMLNKIKQDKEIEAAQLEGLTKCPFCPYACVIEDPNERLLRCQRPECMAVTCRSCHRPDHLPRTCEEAKDDDKVKALHSVEEAMTAALIRKCPACTKPYVKLDGCNKMRCPCGKMSCFICGKIINGYEHFKNAGSNASHTEKGAECPLWDNTEARLHNEIEEARKKAAAAAPQDKIDQNELAKLALEALPQASTSNNRANPVPPPLPIPRPAPVIPNHYVPPHYLPPRQGQAAIANGYVPPQAPIPAAAARRNGRQPQNAAPPVPNRLARAQALANEQRARIERRAVEIARQATEDVQRALAAENQRRADQARQIEQANLARAQAQAQASARLAEAKRQRQDQIVKRARDLVATRNAALNPAGPSHARHAAPPARLPQPAGSSSQARRPAAFDNAPLHQPPRRM